HLLGGCRRLRAPRLGDRAQQHVRLRPSRERHRSRVRRPDHVYRRNAPLLRHAHPQRGVRYRDARAFVVRRLLVAGLISAILMTGTIASSRRAEAAGTCVTLAYVSLLQRAGPALAATPPQP